MARIDFYVLKQPGELCRQTFACRLAEKAYRMQNTVYIHTRDQADAERINDLLWTFRDGSFVPHHIVGKNTDGQESAVTIGCNAQAVEPRDLLINLCAEIPAFAGSFPRVAELVTSDDESRQHSRRRFADYRDQGHTLETHNI